MTRERIARSLLRAYPARTRASVGAEMVGTLLDRSDVSGRAFAHECIHLLIGGLRARARARAAQTGFGQLLEGYVLAGQIWIALLLSYGTSQALHHPADLVNGGLGFVMVLWPILAISLVGARRAAGVAGATWFVCLIFVLEPARQNVVALWFVPFTACLVMAARHPNRRRDLRQLAWLAPVMILSILPPGRELMVGAVRIDALILVSAVAVAIFPIDPRLFVGCAVVWSGIGLISVLNHHSPQPVPLLALSAPLALLATTVRVALARRASARL